MVTRHEGKPEFECDICHDWYPTKKEALKCEKKGITGQKRFCNLKKWKVGDICMAYFHDYEPPWHLVRIIDQKQERHEMVPVFDPLDGDYDTFWLENARPLDPAIRQRILLWAEITKEEGIKEKIATPLVLEKFRGLIKEMGLDIASLNAEYNFPELHEAACEWLKTLEGILKEAEKECL